jgi:hypothetical protein
MLVQGRPAAARARGGEPGLDLLRLRLARVGEQFQGVLPGGAGRGGVARRMENLREASQRAGLAQPVAQFVEELPGVPVVGGGLIELAETVVRGGEAVPGAGLAVPVVDLGARAG